MESPIIVLLKNIIHTFENIDNASLKTHQEAIESGNLSKNIAYDNGHAKVRLPYADPDKREINLQETYLEHLWSFIYSVFLMYEEGIQTPLINNTFDGSLEFEKPILKRAMLLFNWSISLTNEWSEWDETLPNPRTHNSKEEKKYTEKVNSIFQNATAYLMFHEFAHLTLQHESFFQRTKNGDLSVEENADRIQAENDADQDAMKTLIKEQDDEEQKLVKGLSILLVTCSALLIPSQATGIQQISHADLDQRILNVIEFLALDTEEEQFYCYYLCTYAIKLYIKKHGIGVPQGVYNTAKESFYFYMDLLDKIKQNNGI